MPRPLDIWLAAGVRTPFAKVDGALSNYDAIELSMPVARHMVDLLNGGKPDFAVWGVVVPSLTFSNIGREVLMDAGIDATVPAFSTVMACSTSMMGAIEAAGMIDGDAYNLALVGGVDSLSRVQVGLGQRLSDWLRKFQQARSLGQKLDHVTHVQLKDIRLYIPAIANRTTGLSMGEHTEITAKEWQIGRQEQDEIALQSPPGRRRGLGQGLLRRPGDPIGRRQTRHHPAHGHVAGEARPSAAVVRPDQRQGHAHRRQFLAAHRRRGGDLGRVVDGAGAPSAGHAACEARRLGDRLGRFPHRGPLDGAGLRHSAAIGAAWPHLWRRPSLGDP
jgi:hypothetical protein